MKWTISKKVKPIKTVHDAIAFYESIEVIDKWEIKDNYIAYIFDDELTLERIKDFIQGAKDQQEEVEEEH